MQRDDDKRDDAELDRARAAKERTTKLTAKMPCVNGIGITKVRGKYAVKVSLSEPAETGLPKSMDGVPVVIEVAGTIRKQAKQRERA